MRRVRRVSKYVIGAGFLISLAVAATVAWQLRDAVDARYQRVSGRVPTAPKLTAAATGETIYRIDPERSTATYQVEETFAGTGAATATGSTRALSGDVAFNPAKPADTRLGDVVIDLSQLTSDSTLRDARIRADFLESSEYPLATFHTTSVSGLPDQIADGERVTVTISGQLTVRKVERPVEWKATAWVSKDTLRVTASTTVKQSDYGFGPISILGLVSTNDDVRLSLNLTLVDPSKFELATRITSKGTSATDSAKAPSFNDDVRPILERSCVSCHQDGKIGHDVWLAETAGDAAEIASGIATVTTNKYMPPWPPSSLGVALRHPRGLSDDEINTLKKWADAGAPLDVSASTRLRDRTNEPTPPKADLTLTMDEEYVSSGTETNDYRCFVLDPKFTEPTYVTGSLFTAGNDGVVHHVLAYRTPAADADRTRSFSGVDGRAGWECGTGGVPVGQANTAAATTSAAATGEAAVAQAESRGSGLFAGWVPGQRARQARKDSGFLFQPGDIITLQIHYHTDHGEVVKDRSKLALQLHAATPDMHALVTATPVAAVELPCPAAQSSNPLCGRDASIADSVQRYGSLASALANGLKRRCGEQNVTSDPVTGNGTTRCDTKVRTAGTIVDFMGHMHTRGKTFRMILNPDTPQETVLLDIPAWNFDWQMNYQPVTPLSVKVGDVIRIECSWDRSQRVDPSPRYITFAEGTEDEMCFSTFTVRPDEPTGAG